MPMRTILHDEIDQTERLVGESNAITKRIVKERLVSYLEADDDADIAQVFRAAMARVAADVAHAHATLTTRAVRMGANNARRRVGVERHE